MKVWRGAWVPKSLMLGLAAPPKVAGRVALGTSAISEMISDANRNRTRHPNRAAHGSRTATNGVAGTRPSSKSAPPTSRFGTQTRTRSSLKPNTRVH